MEGQRHNNPLNPRCFVFVYNGPKGMELLTHIIVEVAKALGGSFKLVTPAPKPVRGLLNCPGKHKRMGTHKQIKAIQTHKPRLNIKTHSAQPGCMNWSWYVAVHM